jgi:hypothetical protein
VGLTSTAGSASISSGVRTYRHRGGHFSGFSTEESNSGSSHLKQRMLLKVPPHPYVELLIRDRRVLWPQGSGILT